MEISHISNLMLHLKALEQEEITHKIQTARNNPTEGWNQWNRNKQEGTKEKVGSLRKSWTLINS